MPSTWKRGASEVWCSGYDIDLKKTYENLVAESQGSNLSFVDVGGKFWDPFDFISYKRNRDVKFRAEYTLSPFLSQNAFTEWG